jgi:hypothetical protein
MNFFKLREGELAMPIFDRLKQGVDVTKFKADQLLRINRVQGEIGNLRGEIQQVRVKIASAAIELHKQSALSYPELEELCVGIDQLEIQIAEKEQLIASIRAEVPPQMPSATPPSTMATNPCPHCRFNVPVGAAFCPNCGQAIPQPSEPMGAATESAMRRCANCGFNLSTEAAFCPNCGKPVMP